MRFVPSPALAAGLLFAAACTDRDPVAIPEAPVAAPNALATLQCTVAVRTGTLSCEPVAGGTASGARGVFLGGQGTYVRVTSSGTLYDHDAGIMRSDVSVQNLTSQTLGTGDGQTPADEGVRVFFASAPAVTSGTGVVTVANADGTGTFTSAGQAYFQYPGSLYPGEGTPPREWRFAVPATVNTFSFTLLVAAQVPKETGWVEIAPLAPTLQVGDTTRLAAGARSVTGRALAGTRVTWQSADPGVATVDSLGLVTAVAGGTTEIIATADGGLRAGSVSVHVAATADEAPPSILSFELAPATLTANGFDTLWVSTHVTSAADVDSVTFVVESFAAKQPYQSDELYAAFFRYPCSASRISGSALDGVYSCGVVVPEGAQERGWRLAQVVATSQGRSRTLSSTNIVAAGGFPFVFVRSPDPDETPPEMTSFAFASDTVRAGVDSLVAELSFTDRVGIAAADMTFEWIRSGQAISCRALVPSSGTRQAGTLRCSFLVPDDALRGTWNVLEILVRDRNANGRFYNLPDLAAAGFSTSFTVIDP